MITLTKSLEHMAWSNQKVFEQLSKLPDDIYFDEIINEEYRKALNIFRTKLNEVAVFNSNLAYATRLFTEHTTTKQEKINILKRFDNVETIKESKNLLISEKRIVYLVLNTYLFQLSVKRFALGIFIINFANSLQE